MWGLRRRPEALPRGIEGVEGDLTDARTLGRLPRELDGVVYSVSPEDRSDAAYRAAYVTGVETLIGALSSAGSLPGRLLFTSSTAVYGQRGGEWVDETSVTEPESFSGRRLLEGEAVVRDARTTGVAVRFGGIYGPGRARLLGRVREGEARLPAGRPVWTNRIHRDDCAGALGHLLEHPEPRDLYVAVDREPARLADVIRWLAERTGAPPPPRSEEEPDPSSRRRRSNKRCRSDRLVASGYAFRHPTYREGYAAILEGAAENGTERGEHRRGGDR